MLKHIRIGILEILIVSLSHSVIVTATVKPSHPILDNKKRKGKKQEAKLTLFKDFFS